MQHLQSNTTLQGGKYKIERVLGQGGFGITYLARDASLGVLVAVKEFFMKDLCVRDEATLTMRSSGESVRQVERYRAKFIKEARILSRLRHRNIISVIDVFEENGTVYYSMPYLIGGSLQDYVMNRGPLVELEAMKIVRQIADALKYMHEVEHICHYDVKPSNILFDKKGNAMLIDFGISKNYDESGHETSTTPIGRSEGYAPIEQYQQNIEEFSPASDVYGLGATLLFAMTGQRPPSVIYRVSGTPLEMPRYCSNPVKELILSSMIIQKNHRPQTVKIFLEYNQSNYIGNRENGNHVSPQSEETIIEYRVSQNNTVYGNQGYTHTSHVQNENQYGSYTPRVAQTNHYETTSGSKSYDFGGIFIFLGILVVGLFLLFFLPSITNDDNKPNIAQPNNIEEEVTDLSEKTAQKSNEEILSERVSEFARKQKNIVVSFPNDKRYCVYYCKKDEYGRKFLYRYDAISDITEKMDLPIEATAGDYTDLWITKNRFIFVAAEYRYTDFIRIDTQTNQIKYITDCSSVKRTSTGFTVVKSECINEYSATCEADKEYAYTDYYYNEEGVNTGQGQQYR